MALANLVFEKGKRAQIDLITVDVSIAEQHQSEVEITEHPVEVGTNIIDHARPKPDVLNMDGVISNDPLPSPTDPEIGRSFGGANYSTRSETSAGRAGQAYQDLLDLKNGGKLITVVTALRSYDNMMIKTLTVPRDSKTGQALRFSATLIEVRIVSNKTVDLPATPKASGGKKATPAAPAALKKTTLKDLSDTVGATGFIGGLLGG